MKLGQGFLPNTKHLEPDVVMLVQNDGWDIRALKEARSLAAQGYSVVVLGRRRYYTELGRFSDEFDVDIVTTPMILDENTMRLHLESGVWDKLSLYERILSSLLLAVFALTDLKIKPKKVPPPIHADVSARLKRRAEKLATSARRAGGPIVKTNNRSPWTSWLIAKGKQSYRTMRHVLFGLLGPGHAGNAAVAVTKYSAIALLAPFALFWLGLGFMATQAKSAFLCALRIVSASRARPLAPLRLLAKGWRLAGRQAFRYARFFLFTIEYGETVARLNPRVIHAHDLYTLQAATRIGAWTGARVVYDAHELEADRRSDTDELMKQWIIRQERKYAPRATRCITVSHAIADEMARTLKVDRPEIIFNAPVSREPPPGWERRTLRNDLALKRKTPLFVFVGKVYNLYNSNQQVGLIIEAVSSCPGYHLAIVGPITPEAVAEVEELRSRLKIGDRLHLVPPIPAEAIVSYIGDADVGIYLMWPDTRNIDLTIPNKLFEFSLAGLPLVVSDLTSTRWFCNQAENAILVSERSVSAVAEACRKAYMDPSSLRPDPPKLAEIRHRFSWELQGVTLTKFYDKVLQSAK